MRGIIYCIKEKDKGYDSPIYIGSTKNFTTRNYGHKSDFNNVNCKNYNCKLYLYIRSNGGWDNFEMIEIGYIDYETEEALRQCEQMWIDDLGATLNNIKAYMTQKEIKERHKKYKLRKTEYREKNKQKAQEKFNCECGGKYTRQGKSQHLKMKKHKTFLANLH